VPLTQLETAPLGTTGLEITRIGFGAWAIGRGGRAAGWGPQDDDESVAAILTATDVVFSPDDVEQIARGQR